MWAVKLIVLIDSRHTLFRQMLSARWIGFARRQEHPNDRCQYFEESSSNPSSLLASRDSKMRLAFNTIWFSLSSGKSPMHLDFATLHVLGGTWLPPELTPVLGITY